MVQANALKSFAAVQCATIGNYNWLLFSRTSAINAPQFPVRLMSKDFGLILAAAAMGGEEDFSAVIRRMELRAA